MQYKRITKREAKQRFAQDKPIYLCPRKLAPGSPWDVACRISGKKWIDHSMLWDETSCLWAGTRVDTAWDIMYSNWANYNTSYEAGYYAHYYIEKEN